MNISKGSIIVLLALGLTAQAQTKGVIDEVIWVVGDEAILRSEVEEERLRAQYEGQQIHGDPYCVIPEQLAVSAETVFTPGGDRFHCGKRIQREPPGGYAYQLLHQPDRLEREDGGVFPQTDLRDPRGDDGGCS